MTRSTHRRHGIVVAVLATFLLACAGSVDAGEVTYFETIEVWKAKRLDRLKSPTGYLALTGLYWLKEGKNTFGSDPSNDIVFPEKSPAVIGTIYLDNAGGLRAEIRDGVVVTSEGKAVTTMTIYHDSDREHPRTVLTHATQSWWIIQRGDKIGIRLRDSESETLEAFEAVERFATDAQWRIAGKFVAYDPPVYLAVEMIIGVVTRRASPGAVVFEVGGKTHRLDAIEEEGTKALYFVFADETTGLETYGGGRQLYVDLPDTNGNVVIDFNLAFNPPCAFSSFTTCELPPEQNRLPIRVTAGEKVYKKHHASRGSKKAE